MAFKMTPGFGPKMKASNGTPLNNKGDDKEGYNPGGTRLSSFGGGSTKINTYESDKAQLAKPLSRELFSRGYNVIKNKAAQGRMDAYNKSNPVTPPASTSSGRGGTYGNIDTPKTVTPRSGREGGNGSSTPVTPPVVTPPVVQPKKKTSFKSAYDKRDKKIYGNLSQSQFTTESKRQMASKKAGKGYDAPKKQMGKVRKKVEAVKPMKAAGSDVKKQTPKLAGDVRTKAQKLRAKGEGILANKKLSTRQKQKQSGAVRKQYDAEMATQKKKKPVVKAEKKEVVKKKKNERFMF